jgi:hypothetical protein
MSQITATTVKNLKHPALILAKSFICMLILQTTLSATVLNLSISPAHADPDTTVYLVPSEVTIVIGVNDSIGTHFNVSVWVNDVTDLCAYSIQIKYNQSIVNCINASEPVDDPDYVLASVVPNTLIFTTAAPQAGSYTVAGSESPGNPAAHFNGSGLVTIFVFNITKVEGETLSCNLTIDNAQTYLLDSYANFIEPLATENGHYQLIPEFLPFLTMLAFMSITAITLAFRKRHIKKTSAKAIR